MKIKKDQKLIGFFLLFLFLISSFPLATNNNENESPTSKFHSKNRDIFEDKEPQSSYFTDVNASLNLNFAETYTIRSGWGDYVSGSINDLQYADDNSLMINARKSFVSTYWNRYRFRIDVNFTIDDIITDYDKFYEMTYYVRIYAMLSSSGFDNDYTLSYLNESGWNEIGKFSQSSDMIYVPSNYFKNERITKFRIYGDEILNNGGSITTPSFEIDQIAVVYKHQAIIDTLINNDDQVISHTESGSHSVYYHDTEWWKDAMDTSYLYQKSNTTDNGGNNAVKLEERIYVKNYRNILYTNTKYVLKLFWRRSQENY